MSGQRRIAGVEVFGPIPSRLRAAVPPRFQPGELQPGGVDTVVVRLLTIDLVMAVLGQKIAVPLAGSALALVAFTNFAVMAALFYLGKMRFSPIRCFLYLLTFGLAIILQLTGPPFNIGSFLLCCATALPFLTVAPLSRETYLAFLRRFQQVAAAAVGLVFFDHAMQLFGPGMPDLEKLIPESLLYKSYVYIQPLYWGSSFSKPNAVFFLEASFCSQFIAIALILEIALFQRLRRIILYAAGLMAVFAGTGFVLVLAASPVFMAKYLKGRLLLFCLLAVPVVLAVALATGWADIMSARMAEFGKTGSSAHARFIAPFEAILSQFTTASTDELMLGEGAGSQEKSSDIMLITPTKMILDYGVIVLTAYMIFTLYCIFGTGVPFICSWMIFFHFYLMNGGASQPLTAVYCCLLVAGYRIVGPAGRSLGPIPLRTALK